MSPTRTRAEAVRKRQTERRRHDGSTAAACRARVLALAAALAAGATAARADVWDNSSGTGAWSTPSNWEDDSEPSAAAFDSAFFPAGFPGPLAQSVIALSTIPAESAAGIFLEDNYTLSGGVLQLTSAFQAQIHVNPGKTATLNSQLTGFTTGFAKVGSGTLLLSNSSNSFTGTVTVSTGTLRASFGSMASNPVVVQGNGTVEINGSNFGNSLALNSGTLRGLGTATWSGTITPGTGTGDLIGGTSASDALTIGNAANDLTGGAAATLVVSGTGPVVLPFSNDYAGGWQVTGGMLRAGNATALGTGTSPIVVTGPGKLEIFRNTNLTRGLTLNDGATVILEAGDASVTGTTSIAAGADVNFEIAGGFTTLNIGNASAGLSGGGGGSSIRFDGGPGAGFFVLGFASAYAGDLIADDATLRFGADSHLGNAANPVELTNSLIAAALGSGAVSSSRSIINHGGSVLAAGSGATWTLNGPLTSSGALFAQGDGDVVINGPQSHAPGSTLTLNGGVGLVTLATNAGTLAERNLTVNVLHSNVAFASSQYLAGLSIDFDNTATLTSGAGGGGGNKVIVASSLTAQGKLDLKDNKLIVPGGSLSAIAARVVSGHAGGAWNGNGIMTSMPDAAGGLTALGVATAGQTGYAGGLFAGVPVAAADVLVMYTYGGDANLDGQITGDDYSTIDFNIAVPGASGWYNGDFNYDGIISGDDYSVIDFNIVAQGAAFPTGTSHAAAATVAAVPEPTAAAAACTLGSALATLRRRRRIGATVT